MAAETSDAKLYSNCAQIYYYWSERLRDLYRGKKYIECRQGCLRLLKSPYLPHYKRIETLQLLSSVAGRAVLARRRLKEAQRRLDHLDNRKKFVQILSSENAIMMETVKAHLTAEDTEDDTEEDELVSRMGRNTFLDNPPYFDWQASADAPAEATGIESDDRQGFFAGRDAQERWESMIFQEKAEDFYLSTVEEGDVDTVEEEDDDDSVEDEDDDDYTEEEDDDDPIGEENDDDFAEEADDDDPVEEERDHDPIEEALAEKREKAE